MTITIDDDLSARLSEEARRRGQPPDAAAAALLHAGLEGPATDEGWERLIDEMADLESKAGYDADPDTGA